MLSYVRITVCYTMPLDVALELIIYLAFYEWEVEGRAELQHMHTHQQTHKHTNT